VSIALALTASFRAVRVLVVAIAGDQVDDKAGGCPAQRDSSHYRQNRQADATVGAAAENESDAAGDGQRSERFFPDVFADVPLAPTPLVIRLRCGGLC